jgi:ribose transport system permease protein
VSTHTAVAGAPVPTGSAPAGEAARRLNRAEQARKLSVGLGLILVLITFSVLSGDFLTGDNLTQIALQSSINAVIAVGMTLVIITAGIDLSVGSVAGLSSVVGAVMMVESGVPWTLAVPIAVVLGIAAGLVNGALIAKVSLAPFVVTLGTLSIFRGLALVTTDGETVFNFPETFRSIFAGEIGPIPTPVIIALLVAGIAYAIMRGTALGEHIVAVGGNEEAARLSGVRVARVKLFVYAFSGFCATIAGLILIARVGAAEPIAGSGFELAAIAAAAIGGASLYGGIGSIPGTLIGALILGSLQNGLTLLNVQAFWQQVASGIVIILAVLLDRFTRGRAS